MRDAARTKDRIERAAIRLIARQGVGATSIRQIAKAAGISLGALYNHFTSKEDLVQTLFLENWTLVGRELLRISHEESTLEAQIGGMVTYVFDFFEHDWELASLTFSARLRALPKAPRARENPYLAFRMTVVAAMRRGEIPQQDPDIATAMVMGAIVQVIDTALLGRIRKDLSNAAEQVADACVGLLSGPQAANPHHGEKRRP